MDYSKKIQELNRDMDAVYDSLLVLNDAVTAIMKHLPAESAGPVTKCLDECLAEPKGENPPGELAETTLRAWRNMAAKKAGLPRKLKKT